MTDSRQIEIENLFENSENLRKVDSFKKLVEGVIHDLDQGKLRIVSWDSGKAEVQTWLKKAILLYFKLHDSKPIESGAFGYFDKIPLKNLASQDQVRAVPGSIVRHGAFVEKGVILMPSFVNIGAYVGSSTMVDTWATVGSCAYIGKNVHLSGGVGIGGVLEPLQASPVIIEDNVFVGSRAIVVEGVHVEQGAVLAAGVVLTASTPIYDVTQTTVKEYRGRVPKNSVVLSGTRPKKFPGGEFQIPCALIIGTRSEQTNQKTSLNDVLRDFEIPV